MFHEVCLYLRYVVLNFSDTFAMKITATDADQEDTLHSKIAYSIVKQDPEDMFYIDRETGGIYVMYDMLDREVCSVINSPLN